MDQTLFAFVFLLGFFESLGFRRTCLKVSHQSRHCMRALSMMTTAPTRSTSTESLSSPTGGDEIPLSTRVKTAMSKKFSKDEGDVSRVVQCWDNFVAGQKLKRYIDVDTSASPSSPTSRFSETSKQIYQTADCYVDGLRAVPFYDVTEFSWAKSLENKWETIKEELVAYEAKRRGKDVKRKSKTKLMETDYIQQIVPTGDGEEGDGNWLGPRDTSGTDYGPEWKTLGLQDRSVWAPEMTNEFPKTMQILKSAKVPSCEVFFAKQGAKSGLKPHSDKNNFIMTCHLGLDIPSSADKEDEACYITVGNEEYHWKNGETCIFDTSIFHSTENQSDRIRYVLLIRFWHPDLTELEIRAFKFIFEYLDAAALGDDALQSFEMDILRGKDQHQGMKRDLDVKEGMVKKKKTKKSSGGGGFG
jgi:aspartyl/asparaginyl beta-hydroxylase (cupin superfamily)